MGFESHEQDRPCGGLCQYEGPIPPPDILRGFDELVPGTAQRLIAMAEAESLHRREIERATLNANIESQQAQNALALQQSQSIFRSDVVGQTSGLIVCLGCIGAATYLGINGREWLGGAIAAVPTAAVIKAFMLNKK